MNTRRLQAQLDQVLATSMQRWGLMVVAVVSIVVPSAGIAMASSFTDTWVVFVVGFIAVVVVSEPREQLGLFLMAIVLLHWATLEQSAASPWAIVVALLLHVFHTTVALMAATPHSTTLPVALLQRWAGRSAVVGAATCGVWGLVFAFDRSEPPGSATLSAAAFAALAVAVVAFRARTLRAS